MCLALWKTAGLPQFHLPSFLRTSPTIGPTDFTVAFNWTSVTPNSFAPYYSSEGPDVFTWALSCRPRSSKLSAIFKFLLWAWGNPGHFSIDHRVALRCWYAIRTWPSERLVIFWINWLQHLHWPRGWGTEEGSVDDRMFALSLSGAYSPIAACREGLKTQVGRSFKSSARQLRGKKRRFQRGSCPVSCWVGVSCTHGITVIQG